MGRTKDAQNIDFEHFGTFHYLINAEREGFEPSKPFRVYTLSRRASSATPAPLLKNRFSKVRNLHAVSINKNQGF